LPGLPKGDASASRSLLPISIQGRRIIAAAFAIPAGSARGIMAGKTPDLRAMGARGAKAQHIRQAAALVVLLALTAGLWAGGAYAAETACAELQAGPSRSVARILDGETVGLDDGSELRLIGALAPRAIDVGAAPGQWPIEAAATEELRALLLGKSIELAFGGERTDRHGRILAHAFLIGSGERHWVQGHMLEQGLARAYALAGNHACIGQMYAREAIAREAGRGLWSEAAYQVRQRPGTTELSRYRTSFQLIEASIARVAQLRGIVYLNFDADWRQGFSASLRRADRALLGEAASNPGALRGRLVRVRGWIEQRAGAGLMIDVSAGGGIEVLDQQTEAGANAGYARSRRRQAGKPPGEFSQEQTPSPQVEAGR
jgi:micrococcal nuclease